MLDEEHESSFKQDSAPRYHARDVAVARAEAEGIPLVLGSATPSLESWHRAKTGRYALVEMPRRVLDRPLPLVGTIDLRAERSSGSLSRGAIGRQMLSAMTTALDDGGQVILLLNRRGFSTHIQCQACGFVVQCPQCDIALTHHRTAEIALCHYCDYEIPAPRTCPSCGFAGIHYSGFGTQRLEAEIRARFPNVPSLRMDTDAMKSPGSHERALTAFRKGKVRILLGTQMIAKGLDFPNVTLVGVVNADTALHLPDFRAAERTFQLVTQVAGRTGRGPKGGRVLVQTFSPDHPAIQAAIRHDYIAFAAGELPMRQMLHYPPFSGMIRLVIRGPVEPVAAEFAKFVAERLAAAIAFRRLDARVLGPAPCPFARLRGKHRFQIQAQAPRPTSCGPPWPRPPPTCRRPTRCSGSRTSIRWRCYKGTRDGRRKLNGRRLWRLSFSPQNGGCPFAIAHGESRFHFFQRLGTDIIHPAGLGTASLVGQLPRWRPIFPQFPGQWRLSEHIWPRRGSLSSALN